MKKWLSLTLCGIALVVAVLCMLSAPAFAGTITLTGQESAAVAGGNVELNAGEFNSSAPFEIQSDGGADFTVTQSQINQSSVGAYPDLFVGRHGDHISANDPFPLKISALTPGEVGTSVQSVTPSSATGGWHDFYDNYLEPDPTVSQYNHTREEMVIWLNRNPASIGGTLVATGVNLDGRLWDIKYVSSGNIVKYIPEDFPNDHFSGDLLPFINDSVKRGYAQASWYLVDIEHGFEIVSGNVLGIGDSSFGVRVGSQIFGAGDGSDTTSPSTPTGLNVTSPTQTSLTLNWTASTDNVGVAGYHTFNGGTAAGDVTGTSKTFSGLTCGTTYTLGTQAFDAAGNVSAKATTTGTTAACSDTQAPTTPTGLSVSNQTQTGLTLTWTASTDNVGVTGYDVSHNGNSDGTTNATTFNFTGLTCGTTYTLGVDAFDAAGNKSSQATTTGTTAACVTGPTNWYVSSSTGSDSNPGTQAAPFATLSKAQTAAQAGDQIELLRGDTWTGGLTITLDNIAVFGYGSSPSRPIITGGVNGNCVTLSGNGDVLDNVDVETCGYAGVDLTGANDVVKNAKAGGNAVGVHADTGSTGAVITNDTLTNNNILNQNTTSGSSGAFGVLLNGNGATVSGNRITGSIAQSAAYGWDGSAVEIFNGSNNSIHHNTASNDDAFTEWGGTGSGNEAQYNAFSFPAVTGVDVVDGVVLPGTMTGSVVEHNSLYMQGSQGKGIVCYSSCAADTILKDNVVHADAQSLFTDGPTSNVTGNVLDGGASNPAGIAGNVYGNPNLVSPPTDLHETSTSPSVDLATTTPFPTDLDGNAVPQGNGPDSGAYEFNGSPPPDTTPPSDPTNVTAGGATQTSLTLTWTASTDNVGVAGYHTSQNGTATGDVTGTSKTYSGLTCGTTYTLGVSAFDAAGNTSNVVTATGTTADCTVPDTTPPTTPTGLATSNVTQTGATLTWTASTDNVGVTGYDVSHNGTSDGTTSGTSFNFTALTCGTTYTLTVDAFDAAGNKSSPATTSVTTSACSIQDTTPPTTPTNLSVSGQTQTALTLSWTASTDNVGVAGYHTFNGSAATGDVTTTTKTFTGLTCGTTYTLGVEAFDAAGNVSPMAAASGTTSACTTGGGYQHIVWVVMENHSYSQIHGSSSAPYINSLMNQYSNFTNMHAEDHPSAPNYVDMTSGGNGSCCTDDGYHNLNVPSIFSQLGTGARSLEESMPSPCDTGNSGNYAIRHNPEPYYLANIGQSLCNSQDVALGATPDLSAKFTFITPNLCHDMHSNSCSGSSDVIKQGDQWLQGFVPQLLNSPQYQAGNTAIFITWDENDGSSGNQIPTIVIDPHTTGSGQACQATNFNHYSMLKFVEDTFGVSGLGSAASAPSMAGCAGLSLPGTTPSFDGNVIYTVSRANSDNLKAYQSGTWTKLGQWTVPALEQSAYSSGFMTSARGTAYDNGKLFVAAGTYQTGTGTRGQLVAWDLVNNKQLWDKTFSFPVDQPAACNGFVYLPNGEGSTTATWSVIDEGTGNVVGTITGPTAGPHNTLCSKDAGGAYHVVLGGRCLNGGTGCTSPGWPLGQFTCSNGATCSHQPDVGPGLGSKGVRPFTVGKNDTRAWITWTDYRGFSLGNMSTGSILASRNFGSNISCGTISALSHGISVNPANTEVYVMDSGAHQVRVYDASDSPALLATINIDNFCGSTESSTYCGGPDCTPDGWLQHTLDGKYVLVGGSGDVIDTSTHQLAVSSSSTGDAAGLYTDMRNNEHGYIDVNWSGGVPVAGDHLGIGN